MHICHVIEATFAGVRRHVLDLVTHLSRHPVRQTVLFSPQRADAAFWSGHETLREHAEFVAVPMVSRLSPAADFRAILALRQRFRLGHFDVLHVHSGKGGLLGRMAALSLRGRPRLVYTPHASPFQINRAYRAAEKVLCDRTDCVIAVSASERAQLTGDLGLEDARVVQINNGIELDIPPFSGSPSLRGSIGAASTDLVVGSVGRLSHQKWPEAFVRMAARVTRTTPTARFVWVGDGELRSEVETLRDQLGLGERLTITGYVPDARPLAAQFDVFCMLSRYEGLPYAALEAMALERPMVGTDVAGITDLIRQGDTGYLVPPGDDDAAARRVTELLHSKPLRERLGSAARQRVTHHFRADVMAELTLDVYRSLVDAGR